MAELTGTGAGDGRPTLGVVLLLGFQHALVALVFLVYPLAAAQIVGLDAMATARFLTACLLGTGVATCLHSLRQPFGSGSLAIEIPTPAFLPASVLAGTMGGVHALAAVALLSGGVELMFSWALKWIRRHFPAEICGVAVLMLGVSIVRPGMVNALGTDGSGAGFTAAAFLTATATLVTVVTISLAGTARVRLLAIGAGLLVGVLTASLCGQLDPGAVSRVASVPWLSWPEVALNVPRADLSLIPLAITLAVVLSIDNVGMLIGIQRQVTPGWRAIDIRHASAGVKVSGIGDIVAGLFGGMPTGISSANVALAYATGVTARVVSLSCGLLLLSAAFSPRALALLAIAPRPVIGAIMVYAAVYMVVAGMGLIHSRALNERRIVVVGFSLVMGLASALLPGVCDAAPSLVRPVLASPLAVSTLAALLLNGVLSIGRGERSTLSIPLLTSPNESLQEFEINRTLRASLAKLGAEAGADRKFLDRTIDVTAEWLAAVRAAGAVKGPVRLDARVDDDSAHLALTYEGDAPPVDLSRITRHVTRTAIITRGTQQHVSFIFEH